MIKNDKIEFKVIKRQIHSPFVNVNKNKPIFDEKKINPKNNKPKSKNIPNLNEKNYYTHLNFYPKMNINQKPINILDNNVNNINLNINKRNPHLKPNFVSEEKQNNKKIFLFNNIGLNKKINNNNKVSKSNNNKNLFQIIPKLEEKNQKKNKLIIPNNINIIKIEENKNKNLNDIFPKIQKGQKLKENVINIKPENNKIIQFHKNNDMKIPLNFNNNNQNKKIKLLLKNNNIDLNKNNIININNNNQNLIKNKRYILKNKPPKNEKNLLINVSDKNNLINKKVKKFVFKLNINNNFNNININNQKIRGKSGDNFHLKNNNNILINQNIHLQKNELNIPNQKIHPSDEIPKDLKSEPENIIKIKDIYCLEEMNLKAQDKMEDFTLLRHPFVDLKNHNLSLFCIFDGHGGDFVAKYLKENFESYLKKEINLNFSMNFSSILKSAIESIDKSLEIFEESETCGSTGTIVVVDNNNIYCANVGDSKCFYISENTAEQLTEDHNCSNKKEKDELKKRGIFIFRDRVFGSLSLTRAFGDYQFKKEGITCTPHIKRIFSDKNNVKYIVIASDGIWDVVNKDKLFEISKGLKNGTSEEFCNQLVNYSLDNGTNDNISCIVLKF